MEVLDRYAQRTGSLGLRYEPYGEDPRVLDPAAASSVAGVLPEAPGPRKDYQDAVRARFLHGKLDERAVAARLGRPERWVAVALAGPAPSPPSSVPPYVAAYGDRCVAAGVEPFRPAELRRGFVSATDAVRALRTLDWEPAPALKRNYETGEVTDTGVKLLRERACLGLATGVPSIDRAIQEVAQAFDIDDPGAYLLCNRYRDGRAFIAPHQHDFWSATFSFGAPRVFLLDAQPLLLQDGDVLVFGSQRHSVPKMPEMSEERISLSLFWYPCWREDCAYSPEQLASFAAQSREEAAWAAGRASAVEALGASLGASEADAVVALAAANEDPDEAGAALLAKGPPRTEPGAKKRWKKRGA